MCLVDEMLQQLTIARRIVEDGNEVVPTWLITTPEGTFLVLTTEDWAGRRWSLACRRG